MRIAIDGYSACGKSTLARALSRAMGYLYIDTGAMYRAVTLHLLDHQLPLEDHRAIAQAVAGLDIDFAQRDGQTCTLLNGEDVERQIREQRVSEKVSQVAAVSAVRQHLVRQQRELAREGGAVLDGRDIGTVVFPDALLKIFLTAELEVRVDRRFRELTARESGIRREDVRRNILDRDHADTHRADSPLRKAPDAVVVDNSNLSPDEQLAMCLALARERLKRENPSDGHRRGMG